MSKRPETLMRQIERDLIADRPLDSMLRKLILFGGAAGSSELRDWASAELRGYEVGVELPNYRVVNALIQINGLVPGAQIEHQTISAYDLPDFARDEIEELAPLRMGVGELQALVSSNQGDRTVKLVPPGATDLVHYMNRTDHVAGRITALYWSVSTIAIEGVLDQIRTRLAELMAELRASTAPGQVLPTPAQATNAVNLVVNGRGNRIVIKQSAGDNEGVDSASSDRPRFWTSARAIGALVVGFATIAGTAVALVQFLER